VIRTRLIRTDRFIVAVDVQLVVPEDDPSEPCLEPKTVQLLREVERRAEQGDLEWLRRHGKVYEAIDTTHAATP